jgi:hypothetical protein
MRFAPTLLAFVAAGFLSACDNAEDCTTELAQKKATDLAAKLTDLGARDPLKLAELAPKVQDLASQASAKDDDLTAVCKAMDEMMEELSK